MRENNQAKDINHHLVPETDTAVRQFEGFGGHLTIFSSFGEDPLKDSSELFTQRQSLFNRRYSDFGPFFYSVVNGPCFVKELYF